MPQVTRLSRATVVGFRGSPMGPRPPAAGVGCGCVIDFLLSGLSRTRTAYRPGRRKSTTTAPGNGVRSVETTRRLRVDFAATLERAPERDLICVLEVAAHREPTGDTSHPEPQRLEQPGEVHRRRLAF